MSRTAIAVVTLLTCLCTLVPPAQARDLDKELFKAVAKGRADQVRELLAQGANPLTRDKKGRLALTVAREKGHLDVFRILAAAWERQAYKHATTVDTVEALEKFLKDFPHAESAPAARERIDTLDFGTAESAGTVEAHQGYLRNHADGLHAVDARTWIDDHSFRQADGVGTVEAYEEYLSGHPEGAHAEQARARVETLHFDAAARAGTIEALRGYLERYPDGGHVTKIRERLAPLEAELFEKLARGVDVETRGRWEETPLHEAALKGQADLVRALLGAGAEVDARIPRSQFTPLHVAARKGHADVVAILIAHGAEIEARTKLGDTPVELAEDEAVVGVLEEHGSSKGIQFYSAIDSPPEGLLERCGTIVYDAYDSAWRCEDNRPRSPYE